MQMLVDARSRNLTEVHSDVEAVRLHQLRERLDRFLDERRHLAEFLRRQRGDVRRVAVGDDHKVPRVIGIGVHYHETIFPAFDDEAFFILVKLGEVTEDTALLLRVAVVRV